MILAKFTVMGRCGTRTVTHSVAVSMVTSDTPISRPHPFPRDASMRSSLAIVTTATRVVSYPLICISKLYLRDNPICRCQESVTEI